MQIGEAAVIAERTGVPVVSISEVISPPAGRARRSCRTSITCLPPSSPYAHRAQSRRIGNITVIPAGGAPRDVVAFDTGLGNMVIDSLREF
jgi:anhydro-N-acetylmuramic acid kinase